MSYILERIVAADPAVTPERPAFGRPVPAGAHPVAVYTAQGRVALAELRWAEGTVARWAIATLPGQDAGALKPGEIYGYPVDAGLGCFMDTAGQAAFARREVLEQVLQGSRYNSYDGLISGPLDAGGGEATLFSPFPGDPANVAVFRSGWGDGVYASYWGLDAEGRAIRLVTDFGVIEGGDGRTPQRRWTEGAVAGMTAAQRRDSAAAYERLKVDDGPGLAALLREGRVAPDTAVEALDAPLVHLAIALDKPAALDALVRAGASPSPPPGYDLGEPSYPAFARGYARANPDGTPLYGWLKPRSAALMAVVARWEAAPKPR